MPAISVTVIPGRFVPANVATFAEWVQQQIDQREPIPTVSRRGDGYLASLVWREAWMDQPVTVRGPVRASAELALRAMHAALINAGWKGPTNFGVAADWTFTEVPA